MSGKAEDHPLDSRYDGGADEIISDNESDGIPDHRPHRGRGPQSRRKLIDESMHSDADISSLDGLEQVSPDVSPVRNSRAHKADALGFNPNQRRSNRDLMGDETSVRKESLHLTDPLALSDDELSEQDSFADANSNEIVTDDEMSISDDEIDEEEEEDDDDFDENGNYKYTEEEEYEYHEMPYESDDEITVEDALATIMEGEEEEEEEEEEESDEEGEGTKRNGSIHQSLYRFALLNEDDKEDEHESNHSADVYEMALGGGSKSPPKKVRPREADGEFVEEDGEMDLKDEYGEMDLNDDYGETDLNDSGYFMSKEPIAWSSMKSMDSTAFMDEPDDVLSLLKAENWKGLDPFLYKLQSSDDEKIRDDFTKMETFGTTKMYPIHFIVWRAPNSFVKNFISSIPNKLQRKTLGQVDSYGNSPLHLACSGLEVDAEKDAIDVSVVEIISECGPETHEMLNKQGESPLALLLNSKAFKADPAKLVVSEATAERLLRSMLECRKHLIKRKNMFDFKTLLHTAASFGVHEAVLVALFELADPSIAVMKDTSKRIPLHYIAGCVSGKRPQVKIAEKLVEAQKAGVVQVNTAGDTPLHVYVSNISLRIKDEEELNSPNVAKMAEILLGSNEDESKCPLLLKNAADLTPLHCCAVYDAPKNLMEELVKSPFFEKAALVTDSNSATPLHLACASQKIRATLEKLNCFGTAEAAVVRDQKSRTPMHVAAENPKMTKQFIYALAEINPKAAKVRNSKGRMPLHVALRKNAKDPVIRAILKVNPKAVKTTFSNRNCIFHEICEYRTSASIMRSMLKMYPEGAKVKNKSGNLPLHSAIEFDCSIDIVQELLDAYPGGATSKNKNGDTPLHLAAAKKSLEIVELLISVGPKAGIYPNKDGKKPLDIAKSVEGNEEVVTFIQDEVKEYLDERARQKAKEKETEKEKERRKEKEKERKSSSTKDRSKERKRSSRSRSSSDERGLDDPDAEEIEAAPKKPSSLSKIMGRSSGSTQRRRASGGDAKIVDPEVKQEKKPLRRMLKSIQKVATDIQSSMHASKKETVSSDAAPEKKAEASSSSEKKSKKEDRTKSDHSPKRERPRGLFRSKSDRDVRKSTEELISEEGSLRRRLKKSGSWKLRKSDKNRSGADDDGEGNGDVPEFSSNQSRKIRSGKKRESKTGSNTELELSAEGSGSHSNRSSRSSQVSNRKSTGGGGGSSHISPKRSSKHSRRHSTEDKPPSWREDEKPNSESSLLTPSEASDSQRSESDHRRRKHNKSPKRPNSKPVELIKEEPISETSPTKPTSESSVSKHASESTKNTSQSSVNGPVDPPGEGGGRSCDPPGAIDGSNRSVDTEDEWF